jgi:hypothetical protein
MSPLQSRKLLLIAESELNRAELVQECERLAEGARAVVGRARSFDQIASAAATVVSALTVFRHGKAAKPTAKRSWLQTFIKRAGLVLALWRAIRSPEAE